jgi:hypothetical protein
MKGARGRIAAEGRRPLIDMSLSPDPLPTKAMKRKKRRRKQRPGKDKP